MGGRSEPLGSGSLELSSSDGHQTDSGVGGDEIGLGVDVGSQEVHAGSGPGHGVLELTSLSDGGRTGEDSLLGSDLPGLLVNNSLAHGFGGGKDLLVHVWLMEEGVVLKINYKS